MPLIVSAFAGDALQLSDLTKHHEPSWRAIHARPLPAVPRSPPWWTVARMRCSRWRSPASPCPAAPACFVDVGGLLHCDLRIAGAALRGSNW